MDSEKLHDELLIGAGYMAKGVKDYNGWHAAMTNEFGPEIKPYLSDMYKRSKATYDAAISSLKEGGRLSSPRQKLIDQVNKINAQLERKIAIKKGFVEPNAPRGPKPFDVETEALKTELKRLEYLERKANRLEIAKKSTREKLAWAKEGMVRPTKEVPLVPDQELISLRKELSALREPSDAVKLINKIKARNDRLEKLTTEYERRISEGDFAKRIREKLPVAGESVAKQKAFEDARNRFETFVREKEYQNQPPLRRFADKVVALGRWAKLTGIETIGKISGAATVRIAQKTVESAVNEALRHVPLVGRIVRGAGPEGAGLAELPSYYRGVGQGIKDIPQVLSGKLSTKESIQASPFSGPVTKWLDRTSINLHAAGKRPAYRAAYEHAKTYLTKEAQALGKDISNPEVLSEIEDAAKAAGNRSIFLRDNIASKSLSVLVNYLERQKLAPTAGFIASKMLRLLLPIVRVPTNIASEVLSMSGGGLISGTFKTARVMKKGLELATPEEKAAILRSYRNGMIGSGLFMTGFVLKDHFARPYDPKHPSQPGEPREGEADVNGVRVPKWLMHSPPLLVMQAGADTAHLMEARFGKDGKNAPVAYATAMQHVIRDVPFIREVSTLDSMIGGGWDSNPSKELGKQLTGMVPQAVQNVAKWTDTHDGDAAGWPWPLDQGYPVQRKPQTIVEQLKMTTPGFRQQVPLSSEVPSRRSFSRSTSTVPRVTVRTK